MAVVEFIYPNVASVRQRGGLAERWALADAAGCSYVEMPADLVKNRTEVERTGQDVGSFLSAASIELLYESGGGVDGGVRYILHTEPSVPRRDGYDLVTQTPLRWYDDAWVTTFVEMLLGIEEFLGSPAAAVEIHPGDARNTHEDLILAVDDIVEAHESAFGFAPLVLLENRTNQIIADGADMAAFWDCIRTEAPETACRFGFVIDLQQLYAVTRGRLAAAFSEVPQRAIAGLHVHHRHRCPSPSDPIAWEDVFAVVRKIDRPLLVTPAVHDARRVQDAMGFCRRMLGNG
ncbi:hypothetical protein FGU65_13875 [Methanoculleus sp. FWC-SCC1]|uniref:Sugar phosphate isomerase/epimerase n=1 Tax=Methanoculleus frigidifontis TaxID=2584085 RepID=A0ABT8MDD6_9EURY|nr:hypothetical protein [Methanoculleus sp. FWC-SCC1]MDN7025959.1 hypothetical protein [Methanoculleus sp. FWC-SCC1]